MDVLSLSGNPSNFTVKTYNNDKSNDGIENDIILSGDNINQSSFRLNPLLNDSLNNLVKRFERTKIPKPPPTKGQSIRKKSKLSNSLPNIFLPSGFEDTKYNNEKKVQWTNKLNLNLDRLKNAFRDTYDNWYQQKRSQSIPNLDKNEAVQSQLLFFPNATEINIDVDHKNVSLKEVCGEENVAHRPLSKLGPWKSLYHDKLERHITPDNNLDKKADLSDLSDKQSFSTHVYLDGAIIEPISPASPTELVSLSVNLENSRRKEIEQAALISDIDKLAVPVKRKKGRPKKIQNIINIPTLFEKMNEAVMQSRDITGDMTGGMTARSIKPVLTKKQKKLLEKSNLPEGGNVDFSEKPILTKKQKKSLEKTFEGDDVDFSEKPILTKKQKKSLEKTKPKLMIAQQESIQQGGSNEINSRENQEEDLQEKSVVTKKRRKSLDKTKTISESNPDDKIDVKSNLFNDNKGDLGKKPILSKKQKKLLEKTKIPEAEQQTSLIKDVKTDICAPPPLAVKQKKTIAEMNATVLDKPNVEESKESIITESNEEEFCEMPILTKKQQKLFLKSKPPFPDNLDTELSVSNDSKGEPCKKPASVTRQKKVTKEMKSFLVNNQNVELNIECNSRSNNEEDLSEMPSLTMEPKKLSEKTRSNSVCGGIADLDEANVGSEKDVSIEKRGEPIPERKEEDDNSLQLIAKGSREIERTKLTKKEPRTPRKLKSSKAKQDLEASVDLDKSFEEIEPSEDADTLPKKIDLKKNVLPETEINLAIEETKPVADTDKSITKIVYESRKIPARSKPGPRCKKKYLPEYDIDGEDITPSVVLETSLSAQDIPDIDGLKQCPISQEEPMRVIVDETAPRGLIDAPQESLVVNSIDVAEHIVNDSTKSDLHQETTEQSNDIEVLSKSITDSVDTSMLPPRKRYKRLMYLDNSSPNENVIVEDIQTPIHEPLPQEYALEADSDVQSKKNANFHSRLKRKRPTKPEPDVKAESPSDTSEIFVEAEELGTKEEVPTLTIDPVAEVDKPSSLKRSKREAAARGFANMVAMSLNSNNSSQSHETTSGRKTVDLKLEMEKEVTTDAAGNKIFKRPRKSAASLAIKPTSKGKFEFVDEMDDDVCIIEAPKVLTKKQRMSKDNISENPPSPVDTVVSTNSSSHESVKYRKIRTNTYIDPKPQNWNQEVEKCGCKPSSLKHLYEGFDKTKKQSTGTQKSAKSSIVWDCSDNCLNRLTYTECNSKTCQCGDSCNNQKIRKLEWAPGLKVTDIPSKGRGVVTTKLIREGTLITEYVGEVIGEETFQERMINLYKEDAHHYCLHLDGEMLIDAYRSGSVARFVNHSCQPNCEMQKWMVNGAYRMCLFAIEDISVDTELSYDYNFCSFNTKTAQICFCGTANCRGFIGGRPRAEQSESQKDRKKLFFAFGRTLSVREKLFVTRRAIFLVRARTLGRCRRLGIRRAKQTHGNKLPSAITEIKRRKAKKNQFLTQMSALNSIRSIRTRLLQNAQNNETLTRTAQLAQVLRDLYNTLLEQKDPASPGQQLVAPFINSLKQKKYPEFYSMLATDGIVSLNQVYSRLLDGKYMTMMAFDQDILQMMQNVELYAGKQSNIGHCAERIKPVYKDLKMNAIALYEALTDESIDERDKNKLLSNNLTQISNAVKSHSNSLDSEESQPKSKRRKQGSSGCVGNSRVRLERGAEVIKCVCGFLIEAGHVMVQCDRCFVWQHAYCMNVARSSELVDVTRVEPYFCHICLNIPADSLVREIPRNFVITNEIVESGNKLFWTLLHKDSSLLKIDDFVYVPSEDAASPQSVDLSQRTIMRIYSLWMDSSGQRWMEGGLFLRPYNEYLKSFIKPNDSGPKRKSSPLIDLNTHKWHHQEVVYTDLSRILPLDVCVGRCHVLNNHTFRLGKPIIQGCPNSGSIDDVYLCDWLINKDGEWSEIDPAYMKINMKPYCFERNLDSENSTGNIEKFLRQYTSEELRKFDQGAMESSVNKNVRIKSGLNQDEKRLLRVQLFDKLVNKLAEFAYERARTLPLSPPSSVGSRSAASSRGASPLCDNAGSKSPLTQIEEYFPHYPRKQHLPRKKGPLTVDKVPQEDCKPNTLASEYSESSPKLMIVVGDEGTSKEIFQKLPEDQSSSVDEKNSIVVSSSPQENAEEISNPCSEIKYGDLLDLLKEAVKCAPVAVKGPKAGPKRASKKGKKKVVVKRHVLKAVSEINSVDDDWVPSGSRLPNVAPRRETRSRKSGQDPQDPAEEDDDGGPKTCFVKLERMRVTRAEKNRQKRGNKEDAGTSEGSPLKAPCVGGPSSGDTEPHLAGGPRPEAAPSSALDPDTLNQTSTAASNNRSKRKKGVPKRIPFDFSFQQMKPTGEESGALVACDYEVVDLSSGKSSHTDRPDQTTSECQRIESPEVAASLLTKQPAKPSVTATEARHITAANDFSSIENISSN